MKSSTGEHNVFTVTERNVIGMNEIVDVSRYSTLTKLINVVPYILRFKKKLLAKIRGTDIDSTDDIELNPDENKVVLDLLIREEQRHMINTTKSRRPY